MLEIELVNRQNRHAVDTDRLLAAARLVLEGEGISRATLSIAVVSDRAIRPLNRRYLQHDYATDVLSFLLDSGPGWLDGEIIVSADTAAAQAPQYGSSAEAELLLYVIHGSLHLVGYDDTTPTERKRMLSSPASLSAARAVGTMSTEKTLAIVLRVVDFSETSCVVTLFTEQFGKIGALAKGARRPKSPFDSALDLLAICRIVFIDKSADVLDLLTEARLERRFRSACRDLSRLYAGYYIAELLLELTDLGDPHPELYRRADETLLALDRDGPVAGTVLSFEVAALRLLGYLPALEDCVICGTPASAGQDRVLFGQLAGGVLCPRCRQGQKQVVSVSREGHEVLQQLANPGVRGACWGDGASCPRRTSRFIESLCDELVGTPAAHAGVLGTSGEFVTKPFVWTRTSTMRATRKIVLGVIAPLLLVPAGLHFTDGSAARYLGRIRDGAGEPV